MPTCNQCPFRVGSRYGYDADSLENLDAGYEPSCHKVVGTQSIWHNDWPETGQCFGHAAWQNDEAGFQRPVLSPTEELT